MDKMKLWFKNMTMKQKLCYTACGVLLFVCLGGGLVLLGRGEAPEMDFQDLTDRLAESIPSEMATTSSEEVTPNKTSFADVKGAVAKPGMYPVGENTRVIDLIEVAGGFLSEADQRQVNYAQKVTDQMLIYIPKKGEKVEDMPVRSSANTTSDAAGTDTKGKVNLNTADLNQLQTLNGIGAKKAAAIIQYREENGFFQKIEDIKNVSGIGDKSFEALRADITIE